MNLDEVDRISYDAGTIKFSDEAGKELKAVDAASLTTMIVNESKNDVTGVENVSADNSGSGITLRGRLISADEDGSLAIYALDGGQIVEIDAYKAGQTVDVNALPSGVYVVVINGKSVKVAL